MIKQGTRVEICYITSSDEDMFLGMRGEVIDAPESWGRDNCDDVWVKLDNTPSKPQDVDRDFDGPKPSPEHFYAYASEVRLLGVLEVLAEVGDV